MGKAEKSKIETEKKYLWGGHKSYRARQHLCFKKGTACLLFNEQNNHWLKTMHNELIIRMLLILMKNVAEYLYRYIYIRRYNHLSLFKIVFSLLPVKTGNIMII